LKNILFITWDSDKTNYLENLFFPIFSGLEKRGLAKVAVLQFSWADPLEVKRIGDLAEGMNIHYSHVPVSTKIPSSLASLQAIIVNRKRVLSMLKSHQINTIIPRSTMPALLLLSIYKQLRELGSEIIFDADGLPIQERLDQGVLKKGSIMHKILSGVERKILLKSDRVITRTQKSVDWHLNNIPQLNRDKFFLVGNGRDSLKFYFDKVARDEIRRKLKIEDELLIVHSGSLGPAYSIDLLFEILLGMKSAGILFRMLFLVRDTSYLDALIPNALKQEIQQEVVPFHEIPKYLSAADLGISLRAPLPSVGGILPIKLGEYLLSGLPVLISKGIGDLDDVLGENQSCYFLDHKAYSIDSLVSWLNEIKSIDRIEIQEVGKALFSLDKTLDNYQNAIE
jgi:hypothetical protein